MLLGVLVKVVPEFDALIRVSEDKKKVEVEPKYTVNFFDLLALEEALKIKEKHGGTIKVFSLCHPDMVEALRSTIAMGADDVVAITFGEYENFDNYCRAEILGRVMKKEPFDIILCGREAFDDMEGITGAMIAEILGYPVVTLVTKLEVFPQEKKVLIERETDRGKEAIEVTTPVVLTAQKGLNEPRVPSVMGIMRAMKAKIHTVPISMLVQELGIELEQIVKMAPLVYAPIITSRKKKILKGEPAEVVKELIALLKNEAKIM